MKGSTTVVVCAATGALFVLSGSTTVREWLCNFGMSALELMQLVVEKTCAGIVCQAERYQKRFRPKRIFLIRHGLSEGNCDKTLFERKPDNQHALTAQGIAQAREAGLKLRQLIGDEPVYFQVSPYRRTRETLRYILEAFQQNGDCACAEEPSKSTINCELPAASQNIPKKYSVFEGHCELLEQEEPTRSNNNDPLVQSCPPQRPAARSFAPIAPFGGNGEESPTISSDVADALVTNKAGGGGGGGGGGGRSECSGNGRACYIDYIRCETIRSLLDPSSTAFAWPTSLKYRVREDARLREQDFGNYQEPDQMKKSYRDRSTFGPFYYRFHHGESGGDVWDRVSDWWNSLYREMCRNRYPNYVIVTHGLTMRLLCMYYFKWSVEEFNQVLNPDNCEIWELRRTKDFKYELVSPVKMTTRANMPQPMRTCTSPLLCSLASVGEEVTPI